MPVQGSFLRGSQRRIIGKGKGGEELLLKRFGWRNLGRRKLGRRLD